MKKGGIGILDSGVGGFSVLREIHQLLPGLDIHYIGDSAHCPYGTKSPGEICQRVGQIADFFHREGVELIVLACNSATIHAIGWLRENYQVPFVGMEPGVKPACLQTESGVIGVLATEASIAGEKFVNLVTMTAGGVHVITQPCPRFVTLVEQGILEGPEVEEAIRQYTDPIVAKKADVLVLGCTHYPFLKSAIEEIVPDNVKILDTGQAVAKRVASLTNQEGGHGKIVIKTSGPLSELERLFPILLPDINAELGEFSN